MKIIRYAGLEYKHDSKPTHLYHVEREGLHYLLYYKGGGSLSYDAKMSGTPAEVDAAFDQEVEFMGSGAYHHEKWQVATETPDAKAEQILDIFEHPSFGIDWEKAGGGQSSEDQFCDMLEKQIKDWKGSSHGMAVINHPYWLKFHKMVRNAVADAYGGSHRLYRGIHGEQAENILAGEPVKMRRFSAWTSDLAGARTYGAQKTKRGNQDWVVVQRNFTPEEIMFAPVELGGPCENPDILLILMRDVEHVGDEFIVQLESLTPGDYKIVARPRGMKSESLLREYIRTLLKESINPKIMSMIDRLESDDEWVTVRETTFGGYASIGGLDGAIGKITWQRSREGHGECSGASLVTKSGASRGYGPLLYDVAIEMSRGLMSDRLEVSGEAEAVWKKYTARGDVQVSQLDINKDFEEPQLTPDYIEDDCSQVPAYDRHGPDWHKSPLSKMISKNGTPVMDELNRRGLLNVEDY